MMAKRHEVCGGSGGGGGITSEICFPSLMGDLFLSPPTHSLAPKVSWLHALYNRSSESGMKQTGDTISNVSKLCSSLLKFTA